MTISRNLGAGLFALAVGVPALATPVTALVRLKEKVTMEDLAKDVMNPSSMHYRIPYTPEQIRDIAGPTETEYVATLNQLSAEGFTIISASPTRLWLVLKGEPEMFQKTFQTTVTAVHGSGNKQVGQAQIPSRLSAITSVFGLDTRRKSHPRMHVLGTSKDPGGGVDQATIKTAYGFDPIYTSNITGKGEHIAIATYDGFNISDVRHFYNVSKLKPTPKVDQVKFNGTPTYNENSAMETQLDAEFSGMIAPGATVHVFASAENSDAGEAAMFTAILDDNRSHVVNYSWGSCETQLTPEHKDEMAKIFARAVAQGVNIMVASGDNGSDSCGDGTNKADWPGANPHIVAVGGTTFAQDSNGAIVETAWSGSGGGISAVWDLPTWQAQLGAPYVQRSYPDVSFNADPQSGQAVWAHSNGVATWIVIGGTSMAAPQWSGLLTLVGQARAKAKKEPVGYVNPALYSLTADQRATVFNDVTQGSNGVYSAGLGWDAVTGLGTPKASSLLNYLTGL